MNELHDMNNDDRQDQELKAYLEGRDGVSAAYRKSAQEEPPAALDRLILDAARRQARPSAEAWYAARKPYALAASVMIAVVALSLYLGTLDDVVLNQEAAQAPTVATPIEFQRAERSAVRQSAAEEAGAARAQANFEARQLAPPAPTVGASDAPPAPAAAALATDALAVGVQVEPPAIVIDGTLLEEIEAKADAARAADASRATAGLEEVVVTGSRIMRREEGDLVYRASRASWLAEIRVMADELEARSRLVTARRSAAVLEEQLEEEIDLFLEAYPDTDIDAELER